MKSFATSMLAAYVACALWSSGDELGVPLDDNYDEEDLAPETLRKMVEDCVKFIEAAKEMIPNNRESYEQAGHDFWLTRNHHGAGFWDGDWPEHGERLTAISYTFDECELYIGDDGLLYI